MKYTQKLLVMSGGRYVGVGDQGEEMLIEQLWVVDFSHLMEFGVLVMSSVLFLHGCIFSSKKAFVVKMC